ncbi:DUF4384 domain-containing protein [Thermodesulfobacteriota bacterium]
MPTTSFSSKPNRFLICSLFFIVLMLPLQTSGQNIRGTGVSPDNEKRSSIQAVDGYSYLSENMTLAETRAAAFATAKRQALEMARTYIQSKTKVEDFVTKYDLIWASTEGAVTVLEQKDYGIIDNTRYHVWIKAEVEYELRPKLKQVDQDNSIDKSAPLTVRVWTSKKYYNNGESIEINIQGNRDFYARIVDITPQGDIIQLLPNGFRKITFFEAGKVYKIPDKGDHFDLKVVPPYGRDQIVVYASEVPLGNVSMEQIGQGLSQYRGNKKTLAAQTRGIAVVPSSQSQSAYSGAEFYEATWLFTTGR